MSKLSEALVDMLPSGAKSAFVEADEETRASTPITDLGITSTQLIEYIMKLESEFDIMVGDMDIIEFGSKNINEIQVIIETKL